jgi:H+/Cl- antiporter ClcA
LTGAHSPWLLNVIVIGFISVAFAALFFESYDFLLKTIWENDFVTNNRWTIPVGVMFFSLLVGLTEKYLRAPNVINGGADEALKGEEGGGRIDYTNFPGTLLSAFFSLLSGAGIGPEGPLGFLVVDIGAWVHEKLRLPGESRLGYIAAAMASAYNGLIGSPLFTAVLATEVQIGGKNAIQYLLMNLVAGVIGFLFYSLVGLTPFAQSIAFTPITALKPEYFVFAILLGVIGALVAISVAASFQFSGRIMESAFNGRVIPRILAAGAITSIVCFFFPDVMFSGEKQIHPILANPAQYGVMLLLFYAILKVLLLGLAFKSGYLGGPLFPIIFTCTMIGLALSLLFPSVPVGILVMCTEAAALALVLRAPLTAMLLVVVVGTADAYVVSLLVIATVTSMIVGGGIQRTLARRAAERSQQQSSPPAALAEPSDIGARG